ncbi:hypothetical protein LRX75_11380 [Rhizobium sp. DKSPLA3]|uniref:Uncharacterized protein n=1 Tax=Rhizobium quercicola TaxID=2901226 RepID=A0A9X1T7A3_9HYPH|nr:hypothetical protein [Rhizobium quercicola]MCD7109648.1 hypothetical protein [Rhizobium quercicola]
MAKRDMSREELFAMVWERPTSEIAIELGISDVAVGKLCQKLQVPKPSRGYWARVEAGQTPRRPALKAFREELEAKRKSALQARTAGHFTELQAKFVKAALDELRNRGVGHQVNTSRLRHISALDQDVAAQVLLLIQGQGQKWAESGRVEVTWGTSVRASVGKLVERLMPIARPQLLAFETEKKRHSFSAAGPIVFVRWTAELQARIATLAAIARNQNLSHVVMPLSAADHAWSSTHLYQPESDFVLNSYLCISPEAAWIEWYRRSWNEENPLERHATNNVKLRDVMPIDFLDGDESKALPLTIPEARVKPYRSRLNALDEAERIYEMMVKAAYAMDRSIPNDILAMADRIWFGTERPFQAAREAFAHIETDLEHWEQQLEAERSQLAQAVLGVTIGDTVTSQRNGMLLRISSESISLYSTDKSITFVISGKRFRKDGTLGKIYETLSFALDRSEAAPKRDV